MFWFFVGILSGFWFGFGIFEVWGVFEAFCLGFDSGYSVWFKFDCSDLYLVGLSFEGK